MEDFLRFIECEVGEGLSGLWEPFRTLGSRALGGVPLYKFRVVGGGGGGGGEGYKPPPFNFL